MATKPRPNPVHKLLAALGWLIFLGLVGYAVYIGYGLYREYQVGYHDGTVAGKKWVAIAREKGYRALGLERATKDFIHQNEPRQKGTSWKDQLYRQGWESALDTEMIVLPR